MNGINQLCLLIVCINLRFIEVVKSSITLNVRFHGHINLMRKVNKLADR